MELYFACYIVGLFLKSVLSDEYIINRQGANINNSKNTLSNYDFGSYLNQQPSMVKKEQKNSKIQEVVQPLPYDQVSYYGNLNRLWKLKELSTNTKYERKLLDKKPGVSITDTKDFNKANIHDNRRPVYNRQHHETIARNIGNTYQLQNTKSHANFIRDSREEYTAKPLSFSHDGRTPPVITNLPEVPYQQNRLPATTRLFEPKHTNIGKGQNIRYVLIRKNGAVEYYDNLEIIIKKYPHIILPPNIQRNNKFEYTNAISKKDNLLQTIPVERRTILPFSKLPGHSKVNVSINSNESIPYDVVPSYISKPLDQRSVKPQGGIQLPSDQKEMSLKLNSNIQNSSDIFKTELSKFALKKDLDKNIDDNITSHKNLNGPLIESDVKIFNKTPQKIIKLFEENSATHSSTEKNQKYLSLQLDKSNNYSLSSIYSTEVSGVNNDNYNKTNITLVPMTIDKTKLNSSLEMVVPTTNKTRVRINNSSSKLYNYITPFKHVSSLKNNPEIVSSINETSYYNKTNKTAVPLTTDKTRENSSSEIDASGLNKTVKVTPVQMSSIFKTKPAEPREEIILNVNKVQSAFPHQSVNLSDNTLLNNSLSTQNIETISLNNASSNNEDSLSFDNQIIWIRTSDPNFWEKLLDDKDNFVYIFDIPSQTKIEKDTKTTIHANGTIVEEITEVIWNYEDDGQPKVTKTIKITHPDGVTAQ